MLLVVGREIYIKAYCVSSVYKSVVIVKKSFFGVAIVKKKSPYKVAL